MDYFWYNENGGRRRQQEQLKTTTNFHLEGVQLNVLFIQNGAGDEIFIRFKRKGTFFTITFYHEIKFTKKVRNAIFTGGALDLGILCYFDIEDFLSVIEFYIMVYKESHQPSGSLGNVLYLISSPSTHIKNICKAVKAAS